MNKEQPEQPDLDTQSFEGKTSADSLPGFFGGPSPDSGKSNLPEFGAYEIKGVLGQGGMGTVYHALQTDPVRRDVAIKIIRSGRDSQKVLARFEVERQAMAIMSHPSIAKVFDAGLTKDDLPYFTMELVEGEAITQFCKTHALDLAAKLRLFSKVCRGVEHAHQKGIIHRDLKPSNILVTLVEGEPVPKIIDFGLAKAVSNREVVAHSAHSKLTEMGQVLGTVHYMSPEQAELGVVDLDTRTDIYSLGVILFELLTGETPLEGETVRSRSLVELLAIIREQRPVRPSSRVSHFQANNHSLTSELDWIVVKSMETERARRYGSASQFADDVERFLNHEPILAKPPSVTYRFKKFARRYRTAIVVTTLLLATLLVGTVLSTYLAIRANAMARAADENALRSELSALYSRADAALHNGRMREAFEFNSKGIKRGGGWEFGLQLDQIGKLTRRNRRLLAAEKLKSEPHWVRFPSRSELLYQRPLVGGSGQVIVRYSLLEQKAKVQKLTTDKWKHIVCNADLIVSSSGKNLRLSRVADLSVLKEIPLHSDVSLLKISESGTRVAVLTKDGWARVFDTENLVELMVHQFENAPRCIEFSISKTGKYVLLKTSDKDHYVLEVDTKTVTKDKFLIADYLGFSEVENVVYGVSYTGNLTGGFRLTHASWREKDRFYGSGQISTVRGINPVGKPLSREIQHGREPESSEVAWFFEDHFDVFSTTECMQSLSHRYVDLFPNSNDEVKLIGHDFKNRHLAFFVDGKLSVLEFRERPGWNMDIVFDSGQAEWSQRETISTWLSDVSKGVSNALSPSIICAVADDGELTVFNSDEKLKYRAKLSIPKVGTMSHIAFTSSFVSVDGGKLAVLLQETNWRGGTEFFERAIAVYDLGMASESSHSIPFETVIDADFMEFSKCKTDATMAFGQDGKTVSVTVNDQDGIQRTRIFALPSGKEISVPQASNLMAYSPPGNLFAAAMDDEVFVFSAITGDKLAVVSLRSEATGMAFSADEKSLFVGTADHYLFEFSIATSKVLRSVESKYSPRLIFPDKQLFAGIELSTASPTDARNGPLVLASVEDGSKLRTLLNRFFDSMQISMSQDGRRLFVSNGILRSASVKEVSEELDRPRSKSVKWSGLHLDSAQVIGELDRLRNMAKYAIDRNRLNELVNTLARWDQFTDHDEYFRSLRDLYVRTLQWQKAKDARLMISNPLPADSYRQLLMHFHRQDFKSYRATRDEIFVSLPETIPEHEINLCLTAICLMPVEEKHFPALERLATQAIECSKNWQREKFADAMYRLGKDPYSHESNSAELNRVNPFLAAASKFVTSRTPLSRERLEQERDRLKSEISRIEKRQMLRFNWHDDILIYSYLREAERLLSTVD